MLNRRTLNNDAIIQRILNEYDFKIPGTDQPSRSFTRSSLRCIDELIGLLFTPVRHEFISHLRNSLLSHHDSPCKRLQIHKIIFKVQQTDSL